jgi:hypothetical protein
LGGLKMPDKPKATWLRPDKDGVCRSPYTGEEVRTQVVLRGTCWRPALKLPGAPSCPHKVYDPPPEVLNDPQQKDLAEHCFEPWILEDGNSLAPHL